MKLSILATALAALAAAGCSNAIFDDYTEDVRLEFASRNVNPAPSTDPVITVVGGEGQVLVEGGLGTPNPCQEITADAVMEGRRLRLTVHVRSQRVVCPGVVGRFDYTARMLELQPGSYDVEVLHDYGGSGPARFRHEARITVD